MRTALRQAAAGVAFAISTSLASSAHAAPPAGELMAPAPPAPTASAAPPAEAAAAPADHGSSAPAPGATTEPPAGASRRTAWPWVLMGAGVVLVTTATAVAIHSVAESDRRDQDETKLFSMPQGDPSRAGLQSSAAQHDDAAKSSRTAALIVGTLGFAAVAGAVVLWFFEGGSSTGSASATPKSAKAHASLQPSVAPGYAGASFGLSF